MPDGLTSTLLTTESALLLGRSTPTGCISNGYQPVAKNFSQVLKKPPVTSMRCSHSPRACFIYAKVSLTAFVEFNKPQSPTKEKPTRWREALVITMIKWVTYPFSWSIVKKLTVVQRDRPHLLPWSNPWRWCLYLSGIWSPLYDQVESPYLVQIPWM